eukprot:9471857-Karenia_brevis.AAC.1
MQTKGEFIAKSYGYLNLRELEQRFCTRKESAAQGRCAKKPRQTSRLTLRWGTMPDASSIRITIKGDNKTAIRWLQGRWEAKGQAYRRTVDS